MEQRQRKEQGEADEFYVVYGEGTTREKLAKEIQELYASHRKAFAYDPAIHHLSIKAILAPNVEIVGLEQKLEALPGVEKVYRASAVEIPERGEIKEITP